MTSMAPVVSVVIPTYKHEAFVVRALESVWAQTFTDYEIIVVNDGSPDSTARVLAPYVRSGQVAHYIEQPNAGQGAARNRGIAAAQGMFIALLDDDDAFPPDKLAWQVAALQAHPEAGVVYGYPVPVDAQNDLVAPLDPYGHPLPWPYTAPTGNVYAPMTERCWLVSPGQALVRRQLLGETPFDPTLRGCDDWDLWLRLAETCAFLFKERPSLLYRLHGENASHDTLAMRKNDFRLLRKHIGRNLFVPRRLRLVARRYAAYLRWTPSIMTDQAKSDLEAGRSAHAIAKLRYVISLRPYLLLSPSFQALWHEANHGAAGRTQIVP